ncbi:MAG: hypothetical protein PWP08_702 [Methanofollis sp.]|nr:hypothetical protein [Methanofollis sp.]
MPASEPQVATEGVNVMTGDPRKAIVTLSLPMIVAMLLMSAYNLIDAVWVAGLGGDAIAAIGFVTPIFMILMGLSNGLGAGATSAISRRIGAGDKKGADNAAMHSIVITVVVSILLSVFIVPFLEPLLEASGAGATTALATEYGQIVFGGTFFMLFSGIGYGILRAEGDVKRTMYAMGLSAVVNAVLDPVLIYGAGMGIAGAAWATVISMVLVCAVLGYWLFVRHDTYLSFSRRSFRPDRRVAADILGVGLPASAEMFLTSVSVVIINGILVAVSGTDAVAVYTSGWRVVMLAFVPFMGIGTALVTVAGAAYGAKRFDKMAIAHTYAMKLGLAVGALMSVLTFVFAPAISTIFTYSAESAYLAPAITDFLRVMCVFFIAVPLGIMSTSVFQAVGKGVTSFVLTMIRQIVLLAFFAYLLAVPLGWGEAGVWWGIVIGQIGGGVVTFLCARLYIRGLLRRALPARPVAV